MFTRLCRLSAAVLVVWLGFPSDAQSYCRTTACNEKKLDCSVTDAQGCSGALGIPIRWAGRCIGYSVQQDASTQVPLGDAIRITREVFDTWTGITCSNGGAPPSLTVIDLGTVECSKHEYGDSVRNANVIMFRDTIWPYKNADSTLALTTVTFDKKTGELYDADMEVNATVKIGITDAVPVGAVDLRSIMLHEAGHFLGFAHTGVPCGHGRCPVMNGNYDLGTAAWRSLANDDLNMVCDVYAPDRVTPTTCNPAPRHGFSSQCADRQGSSCFVYEVGARGPSQGFVPVCVGMGALVWIFRRRQHRLS